MTVQPDELATRPPEWGRLHLWLADVAVAFGCATVGGVMGWWFLLIVFSVLDGSLPGPNDFALVKLTTVTSAWVGFVSASISRTVNTVVRQPRRWAVCWFLVGSIAGPGLLLGLQIYAGAGAWF